jgi:hypothetical protein
MTYLIFPGGTDQFDLSKQLVRVIRVGFWLTAIVGIAAAVVLVLSSYHCGKQFNYTGCTYIPIFWFIQANLLGLAMLFIGILYYGQSTKPHRS